MSTVVNEARFDPKVKLYEFLAGVFLLVVTVIGIPFLPIWLLGFGQWRSRRYYESLGCVLTEKTLEFRKGFMFRVEKTIPLERIQDLTLKEGPLLRALGLCTLRVETAGQSSPQGSSEADLRGIVEPREFRAAVLAQRDALVQSEPKAAEAPGQLGDLAVLGEIRDSLGRIEHLIERSLAKDA